MGRLGPEGSYHEDDNYKGKEGADFEKMMNSGESLWKYANQAAKEDRDSAIEGLERFQTATGINEEKHIGDLKEATSNWEIKAKTEKIKKAGVKWYAMQIDKSGIYEPIDGREAAGLKRERDDLIAWVAGLPLAEGESNLVDAVAEVNKLIQAKKNFRDKLKKQSTVVQDEYLRQLPKLGLLGGREALLNEVLANYKGVEDAPPAVQREFRKKAKSADKEKDTAAIASEVRAEFEKRAAKYASTILGSKDVFGGQNVGSDWGKIPLTAKEFLEWFNERESFVEMDSALSKLPALVKDRAVLYEERDGILKDAKATERGRLEKLTKNMRRHELQDYMPTLKEAVQNDNVHLAEYEGEILTARSQSVDLYSPFERTLLTRQFKLNDADTQKAKLKALKAEVQERETVVSSYMKLPSYLRDDERFMTSHAMDRAQMLMEAEANRDGEPSSPFEVDSLDAEGMSELAETISGHEGNDMMTDIVEQLEQEGVINDQLEDVYWKIFGRAKKNEVKQQSQRDGFEDDLRFWVRLGQDKKDESDAMNDRERAKIRFMNEARQAWDQGYVVSSSGLIERKQEINEVELANGNEKIDEKLGNARYSEHIEINRVDGRSAEDPLKMIERLSNQQLQMLLMKGLQLLSQKHLGLGESGANMVKSSDQVKKAMRDRLINDEHAALSQLKKAA